MGGGELVDRLGALGPADVGVDHRPLDRLGRPALVPQQDRQAERRQIAGEGADRLGARAVAAVHVERQADDEAGDARDGDEGGERGQILGELGAADGLGGAGEAPARIADREADGLGADIEPGERAAMRKSGSEFRRGRRDQRRQAASLRSASRRTAPQNRA